MDYDKFGICLTLVIVVGVCGYAGIVSGELGFDIPFDNKQIIPKEPTITEAPNPYYEWCYKMGIQCK